MRITRVNVIILWVFIIVCLVGCGNDTNELFDVPTGEVNATDFPPMRDDALVIGERGEYPKLKKDKMVLKNPSSEEYGYCLSNMFWFGEKWCYYFGHNCVEVGNYDTGELLPVCDRPNCLHDESSTGCMARFGDGKRTYECIIDVYRYREHLYILTRSPGTREIKAYCSDLSGGGRRFLDSVSMEDFIADSYYSGCLFGMCQAPTGAAVSIGGVGYSESVCYYICFSAEAGRFYVLSDPILDYNGSFYSFGIEGQYLYYGSSSYSGQLAVNVDEFHEGSVMKYYQYDLTTGETIECDGTERQFEWSSNLVRNDSGIEAFEVGLKNRLLTFGPNGKVGSISRSAFDKGDIPVEFQY